VRPGRYSQLDVETLLKFEPARLAPGQIRLRLQEDEGVMVSDQRHSGAFKRPTPLLQGVDHTEQFLLSGGVVALSGFRNSPGESLARK
jgi:hypothetical protein